MVQPPTVTMTLVQNAMIGPVIGAAKPKLRIVIAVMIAAIAPASAVIEPSTIVMPVAMSAADFSRFCRYPQGSSASFERSSSWRALANPLSVMLRPETTPVSAVRGSSRLTRSLPALRQSGQPMPAILRHSRRPLSWSAMPAFSKPLRSSNLPSVQASIWAISSARRLSASALRRARASSVSGLAPVSQVGRPLTRSTCSRAS